MPAREPRTTVTSMRLTETGRYLIEVLQEHLGLSMSSVVELLVREEARRRGLTIPGSGTDLSQRHERISAEKAALLGGGSNSSGD